MRHLAKSLFISLVLTGGALSSHYIVSHYSFLGPDIDQITLYCIWGLLACIWLAFLAEVRETLLARWAEKTDRAKRKAQLLKKVATEAVLTAEPTEPVQAGGQAQAPGQPEPTPLAQAPSQPLPNRPASAAERATPVEPAFTERPAPEEAAPPAPTPPICPEPPPEALLQALESPAPEPDFAEPSSAPWANPGPGVLPPRKNGRRKIETLAPPPPAPEPELQLQLEDLLGASLAQQQPQPEKQPAMAAASASMPWAAAEPASTAAVPPAPRAEAAGSRPHPARLTAAQRAQKQQRLQEKRLHELQAAAHKKQRERADRLVQEQQRQMQRLEELQAALKQRGHDGPEPQ